MVKERRRFSREFKLQVLRELDSGKSVAQICREHNLTRFLVSNWKQEFAKNPERAFGGHGNACKDAARIAELEKLVGRLYAENDFLKRALANLKVREAEDRDKPGR